jgi:CheY-like chemotaxis protein
MQAQKMEAVGTLAGGIAHDFNNQLTVMLGNARYVLRQVEDDPDLKDALTDLNRAAEHCAQLTRSLLAFSRRNAVSPRPLDVSAVAAEVQELLRPLIPSSIDFEFAPPAGVDWVEADPTQLQQVLVNLAVNARDAMPHGGSLVITTRNRTVDVDTAARLGLPKPGAYVELGVMDTGRGIDEATMARIFEPFFTTKPLGEGTGLGLATAYGIVKESRGAIEVDTAVGSGTTFRVLLPSSSPPASTDGVEAEAAAASGSGTVLVVEDESAVRRFVQRALERKGFEILEAADGTEALQLLRSHRGPIDAVVTDIDMPQMSGIEFARELARSHPETPVLFLSGSSRDFLDDPDAQQALGHFLQKPFTEEAIIDELRRLIAATESR